MMNKRLISLALCLALILTVLPAAQAAGAQTASDNILQFIADHEGLSTSVMWSGGYAYIGYGCMCTASDYPNGITQAQAMELLRDTVQAVADVVVQRLNAYGVSLTQNQLDAILSFTYNFGVGWLYGDSDLKALIFDQGLACSAQELAAAWGRWCHIGTTVSSNLANRRASELDIFLFGDYAGQNTNAVSWVSNAAAEGGVSFSVNTADALSTVSAMAEAAPVSQTPVDEPAAEEPVAEEPAAEEPVVEEPAQEPPALSSETLAATAAQAVQSGSMTSTLVKFSDVRYGTWYYDCVTELAGLGVINGYDDETYQPDNYITCGEALKLVMVVTGRTGSVRDAAAGEHWAAGYLESAIDQGVLSPGDVYSLSNPITRKFLARLVAGAIGATLLDQASPFADTDDPYAVTLYAYGILQGSENDAGQLIYEPDGLLTRAQLAAIVWRLNQMGV